MKLITDSGKEIKITDVLMAEITPDTLMVFRSPTPLDKEAYGDISRHLAKKFPENHILVVDCSWSIELYNLHNKKGTD